MQQPKEDRYFSSDPAQREIARELYKRVATLPLICPHGHVDPRLLASETYDWGTPVDLLIIPDHYILRMLYSQGITMEELGVPRLDGKPVEQDHRKIWQIVCDHWYLFRGTPSSIWLRDELETIFGIDKKINSANAQAIYDQISEQLQQPAFQPRELFQRFQIEVLATTDAASSSLPYHQQIRSTWSGKVIPTFRPDAVTNLATPNYAQEIEQLSAVAGISVSSYTSYLTAIEQRRRFFKEMGATATDHSAITAYTERLSAHEAEILFERGLRGEASAEDAQIFGGHMLIELARMSVEDGLVMQLHIGSLRNHNPLIYADFGLDRGADIPVASEFTRNLKPLLDLFGRHKDLRIILFNLDETTYSRELAPLAGHYPALRLGPPWWFFDSFNGMKRYLEGVVETAGLYNTAGFNDDTRAYPSIPARHDLWRRSSADWLSGLVARQIITMDDAEEMIHAMAYDLAKQTYKLA